MGSTGSKSRRIDAEADEDLMERACQELHEARKNWAGTLEGAGQDFAAELRGGRWTQAVAKKPFDAFAGKAVTSKAKEFCQQHDLPLMMSFAIGKYSQEGAAVLAAAYVSKMQALLDSWEEHGSATEVPADSSVHWEEPQGLLDFMATLLLSGLRPFATSCASPLGLPEAEGRKRDFQRGC